MNSTPSISLIVSLLKLSQDLWGWAKEHDLVSKTQDQEVASASLKVLEATETGSALLEKIRALPEEEADKLWEEMLAHGAFTETASSTPQPEK